MTGMDDGCSLYVDDEAEQILIELRWFYRLDSPGRTLTPPGLEVRVGRNESRLDQDAEADFPDWPTLVEVCPAGPGPTSTDPTVDVVAAVAELMGHLRRRGNRVVAACDFEDQLPRWDQLRADRIDGEDLDDPGDSGDDRSWYCGQLLTGTVVDRRDDGGRHETEVRAGVLDGLARTYRPDGSLWREDWYDSGVRVRKRRWHDSGRLGFDARRRGTGPLLVVGKWTDDGHPVRRSLLSRLLRRPEIDQESGWK